MREMRPISRKEAGGSMTMWTAIIKTEQFGRLGVRFRIGSDAGDAPKQAQDITAKLGGALIEIRQARVLGPKPVSEICTQ